MRHFYRHTGMALATALTMLMAGQATAQEMLTAPSVIWPSDAGIMRRGGNGLSIDRGVASTAQSPDYVLTALSVSDDDIIRFSYAERAAPEAEAAGSCDFTFRRVERALTQVDANTLAERLGAMEMRALRDSRPGVTLIGTPEIKGSDAVHHHVQMYTAGQGADRTRGIGKTWIFVREAKAYYVHKLCETHGSEAMLTELDQRIGLDYRRDPSSGADVAPTR